MTDSHVEQMICRVVEGGGTERDWSEFVARADRDPGLWRDLAESQRDHAVLGRFVDREVTLSDYIDAPVDSIDEPQGEGEARTPAMEVSVVRTGVLARIGGWSGWAVAAMIALAWIIAFGVTGRNLPNNGGQDFGPGVIPVSNANEAWDAYLRKGREAGSVLREVPERVLLDSRPSPDGNGLDLLYLRQVVERTTVPHLDYIAEPEGAGEPTHVRYQFANSRVPQ